MRSDTPLRAAAGQFACTWDLVANLERAKALVSSAKGCQLFLLPELFLTPYFCSNERPEYFNLAVSFSEQMKSKPVPPPEPYASEEESCKRGAPASFLKEMAAVAKANEVVLPITFFEKAGNAYYNSLVVFDADGAVLHPLCRHCSEDCTEEDHCLYRKSHIPTGPGYQEKFFFSPSPSPRPGSCPCQFGFKVYRSRVHGFNIGIAICWDQWFPEAARIMSLQGADILLYPTAIGSEPQDPSLDSRDHWETVMRGHAAANLLPLMASNRIGKEETNLFYGRSFIADAMGQVVSRADDSTEALLTATFYLNQLKLQRASWGLFRDRRIDLYVNLLEFDPLSAPLPHHSRQPRLPPPVASRELSLPSLDGFRMPAEWAPHRRTWMAWPYKRSIWRLDCAPAREAVARVITAIAAFEEVCVLAMKGECAEDASKSLGDLHTKFPIRVIAGQYDDIWTRDTGPTLVVSDELMQVRGIDWNFNGWGGKFEGDVGLDPAVARQILREANLPRYKCALNMEGGSFHVDGGGTLLTTAECLLNPNRNPQSSKEDIERQLRQHLGVTKSIWLPQGIDGDFDTDGHVDNLCAFVRPGEVVLSVPSDESDPQHARSQLACQILESSEDAQGRCLRVHKLVHPPLMRYLEEHMPAVGEERSVGKRIAASYANFYVCNGAVIIPGFFDGKHTDEIALEQLRRIFPGREVVQVQTLEIALGGGNIHCITQQEPAM